MNVRNMEGYLDLIQFFLYIREFILVRCFLNIRGAIKLSLCVDNLSTSEYSCRWEIIGRTVGRSLDLTEFFLQAKEFILVISFINIKNVRNPLLCVDKLVSIREFILVKYVINIRKDGRYLDLIRALLYIRELILLRGFMNIGNLVKFLCEDNLPNIRSYVLV